MKASDMLCECAPGRTVGDRPASLWVAEDNPRAQAFYRRNSFIPDGSRQVVTYGEDIAEIRVLR